MIYLFRQGLEIVAEIEVATVILVEDVAADMAIGIAVVAEDSEIVVQSVENAALTLPKTWKSNRTK